MTLNQAIDNLMSREHGDLIADLSTEVYRYVSFLLDSEFFAHEMGDRDVVRVAELVGRTFADALKSHFGD